jgi:hypothetical protein
MFPKVDCQWICIACDLALWLYLSHQSNMTTQDKEHNEVINDKYHKYSYEEPKNVATSDDFCDLTPFGINKVLNKELPVVLQVIDIMEKTLAAREKVTL